MKHKLYILLILIFVISCNLKDIEQYNGDKVSHIKLNIQLTDKELKQMKNYVTIDADNTIKVDNKPVYYIKDQKFILFEKLRDDAKRLAMSAEGLRLYNKNKDEISQKIFTIKNKRPKSDKGSAAPPPTLVIFKNTEKGLSYSIIPRKKLQDKLKEKSEGEVNKEMIKGVLLTLGFSDNDINFYLKKPNEDTKKSIKSKSPPIPLTLDKIKTEILSIPTKSKILAKNVSSWNVVPLGEEGLLVLIKSLSFEWFLIKAPSELGKSKI